MFVLANTLVFGNKAPMDIEYEFSCEYNNNYNCCNDISFIDSVYMDSL